jgi:MATE family multidrug resistance protein
MTPTASTPPSPYRRDLADLLKLAGPVAGARLGIMAMGLTDVIVVGRHSAVELGYMALGWGLTSVILTAGVGVLAGVQVLTARYIGQGRPELTGGVFRRGAVYGAGLGAVSAVLLVLFGRGLLQAFHLAPGLAEGAAHNLRVFALSLPVYLVATAAILYLEALGKAGPGLAAMWIANAVNLALDLWLVPGAFGAPPLGAVGAAWGTFGARTVLMVLLLAYIVRLPHARALGLFDRPRDGRAAAREQRRIGYGAGASQFVEAAAFSGMNVVAGWIGAVTVAAWAVVLNVAAIVFMVAMGLSTAAGVLVGRAYGARDHRGVARGGVIGLAVAGTYGLLAAAVVYLGAAPIAEAYATDPALVRMAAGGLALAGLFFAVDALQVVAAQVLRACGDVLAPTVTHVFSYAVVMLPLGWLLAVPLKGGLEGILWAVIVASFVSAGLLTARFRMIARRPL